VTAVWGAQVAYAPSFPQKCEWRLSIE